MNDLITKLSKTSNKIKLNIEKKSPELLLVAGLITFAGTVVLACRATLKAEEVIDQHNERMRSIEEAKNIAAENSEEYDYDVDLYKRDKAVAAMKTAVSFAKLYLPSAALAALSVTCFLSSRNIMQKRYLGVVAAYNAVSEAFNTYRKRVIEEAGEQMDRHYYYGSSMDKNTIVETDKKGKVHETEEQVENVDSANVLQSSNTRIFDESNPNWDKNPDYVRLFLNAQQNYANDILHSRGHIFLNEVYDMLGFPHTSEGAVMGWIEGKGDNCVDFGLSDYSKDQVRRFVNSKENTVILEFNHDGVIWDKIK